MEERTAGGGAEPDLGTGACSCLPCRRPRPVMDHPAQRVAAELNRPCSVPDLNAGHGEGIHRQRILQVATAVDGVVEPDAIHHQQDPVGLEPPQYRRTAALLALLHHHLPRFPQQGCGIGWNGLGNGTRRDPAHGLGTGDLADGVGRNDHHLGEVDRLGGELYLHVEVLLRHRHGTRPEPQASDVQGVPLPDEAVQLQPALEVGHARRSGIVADHGCRYGIAVPVLHLDDLTDGHTGKSQCHREPKSHHARETGGVNPRPTPCAGPPRTAGVGGWTGGVGGI